MDRTLASGAENAGSTPAGRTKFHKKIHINGEINYRIGNQKIWSLFGVFFGAIMICKTIYHVNFFDTDAMKVAHHSNYIRWFEIGRVELLKKVGITLDEIMEDGYVFPIVEVSCKYLKSAHFDDYIRIETTPHSLTKAKMEFRYQLFNDETNDLLVEGFTRNVFTKKSDGKIARLPEKYLSRLQKAME